MPQEPSLRFSPPVLMLVTERHLVGGPEPLIAAVEAAVDGGANAIQLREKDMRSEELLPLARRLRDVTAGRAVLLINGPLEVALAADADGIHLAETSVTPERPNRPWIMGRSVHSQEAAERAWAECSDYLIAGPVYETASHPGMAPNSPALIKTITRAVALPVLGIGGVTSGRIEEVINAGAAGVAVISAVLGSRSPRVAAQQLRSALDRAYATARA